MYYLYFNGFSTKISITIIILILYSLFLYKYFNLILFNISLNIKSRIKPNTPNTINFNLLYLKKYILVFNKIIHSTPKTSEYIHNDNFSSLHFFIFLFSYLLY